MPAQKRLLAIAALLAILCMPASAQTQQQLARCHEEGEVTPDLRIANCTAVIQSGKISGRNLAFAFNNRGVAYFAKEDYDRAVADHSQAIKLDPKQWLAFRNRGHAYRAKNNYDRAIADYSQVIKLDPKSLTAAVGFFDRGNAYLDKKDYDRAIADYDQAIRIEPNHIFALGIRCWALAVVGRELEQAVKDCDKVLEMLESIPEDLAVLHGAANLLNSRGFVHFRRGDTDKAIADYNAALKHEPKDAGSLYVRGLARQKKGDRAGGAADIAAAKAIDPSIAETYAGYGVK